MDSSSESDEVLTSYKSYYIGVKELQQYSRTKCCRGTFTMCVCVCVCSHFWRLHEASSSSAGEQVHLRTKPACRHDHRPYREIWLSPNLSVKEGTGERVNGGYVCECARTGGGGAGVRVPCGQVEPLLRSGWRWWLR